MKKEDSIRMLMKLEFLDFFPDVLDLNEEMLDNIYISGYGSFIDNKNKEEFPFVMFEINSSQLIRSYDNYIYSLRTMHGIRLDKVYGSNCTFSFEETMHRIYDDFNRLFKTYTPEEAIKEYPKLEKLYFAYERSKNMITHNKYSSSIKDIGCEYDFTVFLNEVVTL